MPLTPPAFKNLRVNTLNLDTKLSTLLGRYKIIDNAPPAPVVASSSSSAVVAPAIKVQSDLEVLIARTNVVLECKTDRDTMKEVFAMLLVELREVLKEGDEAKMNKATMFLLGALLHRYFRIIQECKDYSILFTRCALSSDLFRAIRIALQFDPNVKGEEYRDKDLACMDVTTIVHCLEVFKANMMMVVDKFGTKRYEKYPHFKKVDLNFSTNLDIIIKKYQEIGKETLDQFKAIKFVQSLASKLEADRIQIEEELLKWSKILRSDHPDFNKLTLDSIDQHINKNIKSEALKEKILDTLYTNRIKDSLPTMDHKAFIEEMNACYLEVARYTLLGAHGLLLQSVGINDKLKFCIRECLGADTRLNEIGKEDLYYGLSFLKTLLEKEPNMVLNCEFFGSKETLETEVATKVLELSKVIGVKEPTQSNAVVLA